jgi:NADH-quinone oxidoreductase subunit C
MMGLEPEKMLEEARRVIDGVQEGAIIDHAISQNELSIYLVKTHIKPVLRALREDGALRFEMLSDITSIDYLNLGREPRFDVVYHLYSLEHSHRLRLKCPVEEDACTIDSICELWSGASFMEREVFDMMGIEFNGHPDPRRILMPDNWKGHPLRKDFPIGGSKSFYYKHDTDEYAGEPDDLVPRIRIQDTEI